MERPVTDTRRRPARPSGGVRLIRLTQLIRWARGWLAVLEVLFIVTGSGAVCAMEIQHVVTEDGIDAWLVEDHTVPLIALRFSFSGGAAADPDDRRGLAHFLSAMLDEGAGELDARAFQSRIEELGVRLSFDAGHDRFTGSFRTLARHRGDAFALLGQALTAPRFDPDAIERIRGQLLSAKRHELSDPEDKAAAGWMRRAFGAHPYGQSASGDLPGLEAIGQAELKALHGRLLARDNLVIAAAGAIDAAGLAALLQKAFGALPQASAMPDVAEAKVAPGGWLEVIDHDIPQSVIRFGGAGPKRDDADFMAAFVLNHILGAGGFGSRLMDSLRERHGFVYSVYTGLYPLRRAGLILGEAATANDRAAEALALLKDELARLAQSGPTADELSQAKTYLIGSFPLRFDSNVKIAANLLAFRESRLGIDYVDRRAGLIEAVSLADVKRLAATLLPADDLKVTIVGRPVGLPDEEMDGMEGISPGAESALPDTGGS